MDVRSWNTVNGIPVFWGHVGPCLCQFWFEIYFMKLSPHPICIFLLYIYIYIYISLFDEILHYLQFILLSHLVVRSEHVGRILHVHKISKKKCRTKHSHFNYNCPITCAWIYITVYKTNSSCSAKWAYDLFYIRILIEICLITTILWEILEISHYFLYYWKPVLAKSVYITLL